VPTLNPVESTALSGPTLIRTWDREMYEERLVGMVGEERLYDMIGFQGVVLSGQERDVRRFRPTVSELSYGIQRHLNKAKTAPMAAP
jgi:hypothetical protein